MGETAVSFGVQKLLELLNREFERLSEIDTKVVELKDNLESLEALLKDTNGKKHESERVKIYLKNVQDIVDDAEDVIEYFLLRNSRREEEGIEKLACFLLDLFKRVKIFSCFLLDRRSFASDIEDITKRISKVIERFSSLGIQGLIDDRGRSLSMRDRQRVQREVRQTFSNGPESDLVGVDKSVEELVGCLVGNDNYFQGVSISGMAGIGKTTLARQVFHHRRVRRHFDGFAWVCVSQEFERKKIWQMILQGLRPHEGAPISTMEEHTIQSELYQLLNTSRYLIVLDDVWKNEHWDQIEAVFPRKKGWRMLLTSRDEGVGKHADPACYSFRPRILTPEESWNLCERIVFPRGDETEFRVKKDMGEKMVRYCGGLPLAVKVLGGLLAAKQTVPEWERVRDNIRPQIVRGTTSANSVERILSLSYEDLSMELKQCFLYLAQYPEDYDIDMDNLFSCWAAEGIIVLDGSTIRGTGEAYIEELVRRNMVIAERNNTTSRIKNCHMHDMMREVCLSKAKEENFLHVIEVPTSSSTINSQSPSTSRRRVVHSDIAFQTLGDGSNLKVRSLICFTLGKDFWIKSDQRFESLPLLRVLDLSCVSFKGVKSLSSIGQLIHLRFLSLFKAKGVSHLLSSLGNLKLLLHLNLDVSESRIHVPNVLKKMLKLRWLSLPYSMDDKTKLDLGELVNLEYLHGFSMKHNNVADLFRMTKLKTLLMVIGIRFDSETLSLILRKLENFEELFLFDFFFSNVFGKNHLRFTPHLPQISLCGGKLREDPMPILGKLLHLKSVLLSYGAFEGRRMVCSKGGFPQLLALEIGHLNQLEEWIVEEGSMPCLQTLTISFCTYLKELPSGIKFISSLKELKIMLMATEWTEKLVPGGEDYYKVQHIPIVQFIDYDR